MNKSRLDQIDLRSPTALSIKNMAHSMEKRGQLAPVVLTGEEKPYTLIDGFKRYLAAESLGLESLKATFIHVDLTQAKIMMYLMNRKEGLSWIQEAMLVRELVDQDGLKQTGNQCLRMGGILMTMFDVGEKALVSVFARLPGSGSATCCLKR